MWWRCLSCVWLVGLLAAPLPAGMLESVWRARELLGPDSWSRVLRIEPARPGPTPAVYALVFELEERLWYYEPSEGTQSLSTRRGRLAQDKADLGPLLHEINPRFGRFEILPDRAVAPGGRPGPAVLPQGCFIESLAYLRGMMAEGRVPEEARLVAYYGRKETGAPGHTFLYFEREGRRYFYDPGDPVAPRPIADEVPPDALAIAREAAPRGRSALPERAIFLPLRLVTRVAKGGGRPALGETGSIWSVH